MVFLDGSESMTIKDEHMSPGRKLLLAERHGWLPADQQLLDPTLYEVADRIAVARRTLSELLEDPTADLAKAAAEFALEVERASEMLLGKEYQVGSQDERRGVLKHEFWKEIPGSDLGTLINHPNFKAGKPDQSGFLQAAQSPTNVGEDFGRRISGILVPPEDGEYRFWIYSDDQCILKLNNAGEKPENAKEILRVSDYSPADWEESRRSRPIALRLSLIHI